MELLYQSDLFLQLLDKLDEEGVIPRKSCAREREYTVFSNVEGYI